MIAKNGIFFLPGKLGAFSDAHSTADVKEMKKATESYVTGLKR
jgi:glutamate-1-semialdehyde 2,1-aminomutase